MENLINEYYAISIETFERNLTTVSTHLVNMGCHINECYNSDEILRLVTAVIVLVLFLALLVKIFALDIIVKLLLALVVLLLVALLVVLNAISKLPILLIYTKKRYKIVQVDFIKTPKIKEKFNAKRAEFKARGIDTNAVTLFHGTKIRNLRSIYMNNFDLDKCKRFFYGRGIYFSDDPEYCLIYGEAVLVCRVLPGRGQEYFKQTRLENETFDSMRVSNIHMIADPDQILPCGLLRIKEVEEFHWRFSNAFSVLRSKWKSFMDVFSTLKAAKFECKGCRKLQGHSLCRECRRLASAVKKGFFSPAAMTCDYSCETQNCFACRILNMNVNGEFDGCGKNLTMELEALKKTKSNRAYLSF